MHNFLDVFKYIIPFVVGTEAALGNTATGPEKKEKVLQMLQSVAKVGELFPNPTIALLSKVIDVTVAVFLPHETPTPAPAAPTV